MSLIGGPAPEREPQATDHHHDAFRGAFQNARDIDQRVARAETSTQRSNIGLLPALIRQGDAVFFSHR